MTDSAEVIQQMVDGGFLTKENIVSSSDNMVSAVVIVLSISLQSVYLLSPNKWEKDRLLL